MFLTLVVVRFDMHGKNLELWIMNAISEPIYPLNGVVVKLNRLDLTVQSSSINRSGSSDALDGFASEVTTFPSKHET